jgi:cob(I)alamin adenosyltransferase
MEGWLERYARALRERLGPSEGTAVQGLADAEAESILDLARIVAHRTERRNAPLSSYLAGQFVAARVAGGATPASAAAEAGQVAEELLGDAPT